MSATSAATDERTAKILLVKDLVRTRDEARAAGNYVKSDNLRELLIKEHGVELIDQKNGPSGWRFKDGSSRKIPSGTKLPQTKKSTDTAPSAIPDNNSQKKRQRTDEPDISQAKTKKVKGGAEQKLSSKGTETERNKNLVSQVLGGGPEKSSNRPGSRILQGVLIEDIKPGFGKRALAGSRVKVNYVGRLKSNNKIFDSSVKKPFAFRLGTREVIAGWDIGCEGMQEGGTRRLTIPPEKAYGKQGAPPTIPPNSTLIFDVTLISTS